MSVNGLTFLGFLFAFVILYYCFPKKARWVVLLVSSVAFYLSYSIKASLYLAFTVVFTYCFSQVLGRLSLVKPAGDTPELKKRAKARLKFKKRAVLTVAIIVNFFTLALLKYSGFVINNINNIGKLAGFGALPVPRLLLPLGISFYIFQTTGYLIDLYRGKYPPEKNILKYALFVSFFPQMVQGPINRHNHLAPQLYEGNAFDVENFQHGLLRMMLGILKKAMIADPLAKIVSAVYSDPSAYPGAFVFIGVALYCVRLYCDFSGGVDLLNGAARLFGIKMAENFEQPYFAVSLSDFWRRWHISLGEWMKDYLFYPLALSKGFARMTKRARRIFPSAFAKRIAPCLATFIVFLAVGAWQGPGWANIAYGLWNGGLMSLAMLWVPVSDKLSKRFNFKINKKLMTVLAILRTNLLVIIGRYFSNSASLRGALGMLKVTALSPRFSDMSFALFEQLGLTPSVVIKLAIALCILFCISLAKEKGKDVVAWFCNRHALIQYALLLAGLFIIVFAVYANTDYTPIAYVYENV